MNTVSSSEISEETVARGRRLAMVRATVGMTQLEFADKLDVNRRSYIAWEQGHREIPNKILVNVRRQFNIDPSWILDGTDGPPRAHTSELDPTTLRRAFEMVKRGLHHNDLKGDEDVRYALIAEAYRLLIETPNDAERTFNSALKIINRR